MLQSLHQNEECKELKMGPVGKNENDGMDDEAKISSKVICKSEKVTELDMVFIARHS
jgi:hypothetical protein